MSDQPQTEPQPHKPAARLSVTWLYALFTAWLFVGVALFQLFPVDVRAFWIDETGPVETFSALGYFVCASVAVCWFGRRLTRQWYLVAILLLMGLRELDFHDRFTTMGVFKRRFYYSEMVPLSEKLVVGAILLGLGVALALAIRREAPTIVRAARERSPVLIGVVWGLVLAVLSKGLDGLARHAAKINLALPDVVRRMARDGEEILELGVPIMFMTALLCHIFVSEGRRQAPLCDEPSSG